VSLQPIFTQIYPRCYSKPHTDCSAELVDSQTYTQVRGPRVWQYGGTLLVTECVGSVVATRWPVA